MKNIKYRDVVPGTILCTGSTPPASSAGLLRASARPARPLRLNGQCTKTGERYNMGLKPLLTSSRGRFPTRKKCQGTSGTSTYTKLISYDLIFREEVVPVTEIEKKCLEVCLSRIYVLAKVRLASFFNSHSHRLFNDPWMSSSGRITS